MSEQDDQDSEKETTDEAPKKAAPAYSGSEKTVVLNGKIQISLNSPLQRYNMGDNKAYRATLKDEPTTGLIAIVCEPATLPRLKHAQTYSKIINPNVARLVSQGATYWPPAKQERYILVYFENWGHALLAPDAKMAMGWKADDVMDVIVKPMINVLRDFKDKDFVHGGIRPTNIFGATAEGGVKKIVLGDGLSTPASYLQPALFEPIERAMSAPIARGTGTPADDLYAFAVMLAVMLRHNDPLAGLNNDQIIRRKIELGSYATITGKDRFKGEILELLRGLLHDDPTQRWTIDEVLVWLDGRRLSPKQALVRKKAPRPISFMDEKYFYLPNLAMDLGSNPTEVKRIIDDDTLMQWLKRSVEDEAAMMRVEKALANAKEGGTGKGYEDRLASNLSAALDTLAPFRFHGHGMSGDGVGIALAQAIVTKQDLKFFTNLLSSNVVLNWLGSYQNESVDISGLFTRFEQCRRFVKSSKTGEGIERCLYVLSPGSFCLSELLEEYTVVSPADLLRAFEDLCQQKRVPPFFLDRHSVAFLMERDHKSIEHCLYDLNSGQKHKVVLGNLKCLASLQQRYNVKNLTGLSQVFAKKMSSVYERYHDRNVREKLEEGVKALANSGNLVKMAALVDNVDVVQKDAKGFKAAQVEYEKLRREAQDLEFRLEDKDNFGLETGREWAAVASSALAIIVIIGSAMALFSGDKFF